MKAWTDIHDDPAGWVDVELVIRREVPLSVIRRIHELRALGASQRRIARELWVSQPYVSRVLAGVRGTRRAA